MKIESKHIEPQSPFENINSISDLLHNCSLLMSGSNLKARMAVAVATAPLETVLEKKKHLLIYKKICNQPEMYNCKIANYNGSEKDQASNPEWIMVNFKETGVYWILSFSNYKLFLRILGVINGFYPKVARTYFDTGYLYNFLKKIDKENEYLQIRISKVVAKNRIDSEGAQKYIASSIDWTDISYQEAFDKINEENAWLKSIDLNLILLENGSMYEAAGTVTRNGTLVCKNNIKVFYYLVVNQALNKASKDKELFTNRSRKENPGLKVRPLSIDFEKPIFRDKSNNKRLKVALKKMPHSSLSVFHANPYFQASMIDYRDGSTYRIWVLSENTLTIVPQMRATVGSLQRLFNHIGERFMEGKIVEI